MSFNTQRCRFLSHITWGNIKNHYRKKYLELKKSEKISLSDVAEQIGRLTSINENQLHLITEKLNTLFNRVETFQSALQKLDDTIIKQHRIEELLQFIIQQQKIIKRIQIETSVNFYKNQIMECGLFDEEFYVKSYPDYKDSGLTPLDHYLQIGWQMRYNPSADFDTSRYIEKYHIANENPLIHFISEGKWRALYAFDHDSESAKEVPITNHKNKYVVYTCIIGNYDTVKQHKYIAPGWDYICFTDNVDLLEKKQVGMWTMCPIQKMNIDPTRLNRFYKINPHIILSEYEESLYIDANISIITPLIFDIIKKRREKEKLLLPIHFVDKCAYDHGAWIIQSHIDITEKVRAFIKIMENDHFPHNYGMTENNIIYRKHHDPQIINMMEEWWMYVLKYCKRDQLSWSYILWKNNISVESVSFYNARINTKDFKMIEHEKV